VSDSTDRIVPFTAGDGRSLNLIHVRGNTSVPFDSKQRLMPVLLVHGAGVRANIFRPLHQRSLVDALLDAGYDVWLENWRASIDFEANEWTLDQAAVYDHPAAVAKVVEETGTPKIAAVIHCQGSTSFTMSVLAGLVPQVSVVISNAVSLHPVVPAWSEFKLNYMAPLVRTLSPYLNPHWGIEAKGVIPKMITGLTRMTHRECDNTVCKLVSFAYGSGFPALWSHDLISEETHEWIKQEFGFVPLRFHGQMKRCVQAGHLVSVEQLPQLPTDFPAAVATCAARFAFFAGEENLCFLPESQRTTHAFFEKHQPGVHSLHVIPKYGHLDMFFGTNAYKDVFPLMLNELSGSTDPQDHKEDRDDATGTN
jgi:pimeloyl-ACP methyl ester carboxylesterase